MMNLDAYLKSKPIHSPVETEIYHWHNNYILDSFLVDLALEKCLIKNYTEFNQITLYLNAQDLEMIIETIQNYMTRRFPFKEKTSLEVAKLKWQKALHTFENCLNTMDFKNNSLYYYCTLSNE
ncbi:hypothetical protein [Cellulosilyticum sp. I15G10I2]|uniref:hypothetical protein n=1 Tax=Cellulosilyticum sp. I15G10I2 TaxID=1892843 RepID=UPI00085C0D30|nr:hypothetical protein [Cellulosilyticum sp. I15G10I2]